MNTSFLSLSIVFFGICIFVGSWLVSKALQDIAKLTPDTVTVTQEQNDWELIVVNEARAEYQRGESVSNEELQKELNKWLRD